MEEFPIWKQNRPKTPHKLLNDLVSALVDFYSEHLRRDIQRRRPGSPDVWDLLSGSLVAAMQTYASICILLADQRPKPLMLQTGVLNRVLFEILTTVFGILEDPISRTKTLLRESFKSQAMYYQYLQGRWGSDPEWTSYFKTFEDWLEIVGNRLGIPDDDRRRAATITDHWPTPGIMIYGRPSRKIPPFVTGARREVLKEIYDYHYPHQSAQAHGRGATVAIALLVDNPEMQWNPGAGESNVVASALLFMACILSELEAAGDYRPHPKLLELWAYLREIDGEAKDLWALRYEKLSAR